MVYDCTEEFVAGLAKRYNIIIRASSTGPEGSKFRFVTHYWIGQAQVETVIDAIKTILA